MRRDGERGQGHVRSDGLAGLGGDAAGLGVGDDGVEEVGEDGGFGAWGVWVDEEVGVFCRKRVVAWFGGEAYGGGSESFLAEEEEEGC